MSGKYKIPKFNKKVKKEDYAQLCNLLFSLIEKRLQNIELKTNLVDVVQKHQVEIIRYLTQKPVV